MLYILVVPISMRYTGISNSIETIYQTSLWLLFTADHRRQLTREHCSFFSSWWSVCSTEPWEHCTRKTMTTLVGSMIWKPFFLVLMHHWGRLTSDLRGVCLLVYKTSFYLFQKGINSSVTTSSPSNSCGLPVDRTTSPHRRDNGEL